MSKAGYRSPLAFWVGGAFAKVIRPEYQPPTGGQWYDIKYESEWVRDHNNEWIKRIVRTEDWLEDYILAEDDLF